MSDRLLVVDGDPTSLRVMDVSLRSAGFDVETATNGTEAWAMLESGVPDLIITDTALDGIDGFELCLRLRKNPLGATIPVIFLAADKTLEHKIRSLAAGVSDYLVKPAYIKEVVARVRALLQRRDRERLASNLHGTDGRDHFAGNLADIAVVDLVQLIEGNGRSGMADLRAPNGTPAAIYFRHGKVVDAEVGRLSGFDALSRLFSWTAGSFDLEWRSIRRKDVIERPSRELVHEGMKRLDEWNRLLGALSDSNAVFEVDYRLLAERLAEIPDEVNGILRLCDGVRSILQVVEDCAVPDVEALTALIRLRDEGIVYDVSAVRAPEREVGSSRFPDWLGAGSSPFSLGASGAGGTGRVGIGSGPVEQSFADRLQVEAEAEISTAVPAETKHTDPDTRPPRHRTAPGLGQPVTAAAPDALPSPGEFLRRADGIPEARADQDADQDNVIEFPRQGDSRIADVGSVDPAREDSGAPQAAPMPAQVETPSGASPASNARPTQPLGRAGQMSVHRAEQTTPDVPPHTPASIPERVEETATGPALTDTYRGFGPKPGQVISRRGGAHVETQAPGEMPARDSGRLVASGTLTSSHNPTDLSPEAVDQRAPTDVAADEGTVRVSFPDDDITRGDALDELGLPSRWRGMRVLAVAALAGVLAVAGVYIVKSKSGNHGETSGGQAAIVLAPVVAPNHAPVVAPSTKPLVPAPPDPSKDNPIAVAPNAAPPVGASKTVVPGVEPPSTRDGVVRPGFVPGTESVPSNKVTKINGPSESTSRPADVVRGARVKAVASDVPVRAPMPTPTGVPAKAAAPPGSAQPAISVEFSRQLSDCRAAFARNKLRDALSACTAAVEANPNSAEALALLAHTELNRGRLVRAGELATKAVTLDPNLADAYVIIGGARQDSGQNREAKAAYRRYLQLAPQGRYADELRSIVNTL